MRDTKPKTYRVVQGTIDGVPVLAERWGVPDGEVIDRLVAGELAKGWDEVDLANGRIDRKPLTKPNGKL